MNIYVGNLSHQAVEDDLRQAFEAFGQVSKVTIIKDKFTGEPRGFGFVEMPNKEEADAALKGLEGKPIKDRSVKISEARPRQDRGDGGDRGGDRRRGGGGYGGGGGRGGGRDRY
jgi:RNA recognition motif-containing protein